MQDKRKTSLILFGILAIAFILRIIGLNYGLPMFFIGDEQSLTGGALRMLQLQTLVPAFYPEEFRLLYYPPLICYLYLIFIVPVLLFKLLFFVSGTTGLISWVAINPGPVWIATRLATAILGTLTVFVAYGIAKKLFSSIAGYFAAAFVATSFLSVSLSHFARHWVPAAFFAYLVVACALLIYLKPDRRNYLWAGVLSGLAFGASYVTTFAVLVVVLCHFIFRPETFLKKLFSSDLWKFAGIFVSLASFFAWLNFPEFSRILWGEDSTAAMAKSLTGLFSSLAGSAFSFFNYEPVLCVAAVLGILILLVTNRKLAFLFFTLPLVYWSALYFVLHFEPRYNLLLVPWFAILGALALLQIWELPFVKLPKVVAVAVILLIPFSISVYYNYLLLQPDSRQDARTWIENNLPPQSRVALYARTLELTPTKQAAEDLISRYPYVARTRDRVLANLPPDDYPQPAYNLLNLLSLKRDDWPVIGDSFDYLVVESYNPSNLLASLQSDFSEADELASFRSMPQREVLPDPNGNFMGSVFNIFRIKSLGPTITIYKF